MSSEDKSWVFDSLVGFLKGPLWNGPINSFVEQKSIFFESGENTTEEHSKIHNEYKNLVDYMLGTYMEEMGITPAEFENACCEPTGEIEAKLHQTLFEQIWAANDMDIFQQMMAEKNLDLQLQALEMIHNRFGVTPQSYVLNFSPKRDKCESVLEKQVVKLSLEHETKTNDMPSPRLSSCNENTMGIKKVDKEENEASLAAGGKTRKTTYVPTAASKSKTVEPEKMGPQPDSLLMAEEKLQKRKEYLKSQRDKLVQLKKREEELTMSNTNAGAVGEIPQSGAAAETSHSVNVGNGDINPKTLQIRKALAKRLKEEVIKKPQSSTE
ncbi:cilia- and flagella-associated protein 36 [Hetaerina americana]|uniref:cilia- and flagella-associated protein 36 n=1 Tax=Hetaerina americana TaxID=62018 RepID=UPI003A7F4952